MRSDQVKDKETFLQFLAALRVDLQSGGDKWANVDLEGYLEAISAWVQDWPHPFETNPWEHVAAVLEAGAVYE